MNDELIELIKELNIVLECGIQTLDPIVQNEIRRINKKERMINTMNKLKNANIPFETHLIYGLPKQTFESLRNDYLLLKQFTSTIKLFPLIRLRGTGLDVNLNDNVDYDLEFSPIFPKQIIRTQWMSSFEIFNIKKKGVNFLKHFGIKSHVIIT